MENIFLSKEELEKILAKLPPDEAERVRRHNEYLINSAKNSVMAGIIAKNLSHGVGINILP